MVDRLISKIRDLGPLFTAFVLIPSFCAIIYFLIVASDVYVSESSFIIHSADRKSSIGIGALFQGGGLTSPNEEAYAVHEYIASRDAVRALNDNHYLDNAFGRKSVDIFDRFGGFFSDRSFEALIRYFRKRVSSDYDPTSSITTLAVRAYTAQDAQRINSSLLRQSEELVNRINQRSREDMIAFAQRDVRDAEVRAKAAALALSNYRMTRGVVDPEKQAATQLQFVAKLQDELLSTRSQLAQLRAFTPQNPQIGFLEKRVSDLQSDMESENAKVTGGDRSLAGAAAPYQRVLLDSQFADKQLTSALASLEEARSDARRKQAYVEVVVSPNLPDTAVEPRRLRGVFATFMLGLIGWGVSTMLLAGLREHQD